MIMLRLFFLYFFYTNKPGKYNELLNVGHIIGK